MRFFITLLAAAAVSVPILPALAQEADSTLVEYLSESVVTGVRAQPNAPYAVVNLERAELSGFAVSGKELPMLLSRTPGVLAWSENGMGTGTSYMRIRGAGDSRINVTIDGVPLNSPEDQCVFWANMNSYSAFLGSVQLQRGVGASTNGDGAFGGTISLSTKAPSLTPSGEISASYGSYNTSNYGVSFSSGLIGRSLTLDGAWHETVTDGYLHGTSGKSGSFYAGIAWLGSDFIIRYRNISNYEHTGQAWNGVTAGNDDLSLMDGTYGNATGIKTYADLYARGLGRFNSLYERIIFDSDNYVFPTDADGNYLTERYKMSDGSFWPRTTDNFVQDHNILSASVRRGSWMLNAALHYTYGSGYYEEFRPDNKLSKFGLGPVYGGYKRLDFVRRKGLTQHTYGLVGSAGYKKDAWDVIAGVSLQQFRGNHFGYLTYTGLQELSREILKDGKYQYYDSDALKGDYSAYVKAAYSIGSQWEAFADLQFRHVDYSTDGINDKFYEEDSRYYNQPLDIVKHYNFFNPKTGISYTAGSYRAYASVALSHREPERNNFTDNGSYPAPEPESLVDWELGHQFSAGKVSFSQGFYFMDYNGQFVQTGEISDIGEALTTNIKDSYRLGMETSLRWDALPWLSIEGNAALSRNRILDFDEHAEDWDKGETVIHYGNSTLAFSPSAILNGFIEMRFGAFSAVWHTGFVSRQYLDNTQNRDRSLPAYSTSELDLKYALKPSRKMVGIKEIDLGCRLGNIFNAHYAANGWVYSAIYVGGGHPDDNRYYQIGFMPMAGFTAMGSVNIRF